VFFVVEWIVLNALSSMLTDILYLLRFPRQTLPKEVKQQNWMKNKNSIFQIYEILEFVPLLEKKMAI
jgi:broad-specificity NMP kinase